MQINILTQVLAEDNIQIHSISEHTKASESYVEVTINQENGFSWNGLIPYYYRRTGLFLETEQELAAYLIEIKPYFTKEIIENWIRE